MANDAPAVRSGVNGARVRAPAPPLHRFPRFYFRTLVKGERVPTPAALILLASLCLLLMSAPARSDEAQRTPIGYWDTDAAGLPVFVYTMDEFNDPRALYPTSNGMSNDHWHLVGNGRMVALAYNHGEVQIYSGERGATWLNERDPARHRFAGGYGFLKDGNTLISMRYPGRPQGCDYERRFGIGCFEKKLTCPDIRITQTISAPPGEITALVSEVEIENLSDRPKEVTWYEYWDVNPFYFGMMPELSGEGGESDGKGQGLGSLTPVLMKALKFIPGQFTLSRLVAGGLHSWRASAWKDFRLTTEYTAPDPYLIARVKAPAAPISCEAKSDVNYFPPIFFLLSLDPGARDSLQYETHRHSLFDSRGRFTGRLHNGVVDNAPVKNGQACLCMSRKIGISPGVVETARFATGYIFGKDLPCGATENPSVNDLVHTLDLISLGLGLEYDDSKKIMQHWRESLPAINIGPQWLDREMLWHAYYLRALATYDDYFQSRTISQGCAYQYMMGLNIAARDPLQHMLPVVYLEPALARDVLRYTLSEMDNKGFIPYGIKGVGMRTAGGNPFPSDTNLYLMLALTEYVTATRDFAFLDQELPYYQVSAAPASSLTPQAFKPQGTVMDHMRKAYDHQIAGVGIGADGLVKLRNSDWSDTFVAEVKVQDKKLDLGEVGREAESVLNTAMAACILPRFAALVRAHGDAAWADEIESQARSFRDALRRQWNGKWFNRAILPGGKVVGTDTLFIEPQPWAVLADALDVPAELGLDETMHADLSSRSPIGAVERWPLYGSGNAAEKLGMGTNGGIWYSLRFPLIMSYARLRPAYAWEEFLKMTNHAHAAAYPDIWIGQWSGPDAYNAPQSVRPGWTTDVLPFSGGMMDFPVMCGHAHAAPWFSLLKLMGIRPGPQGFTIDPRMPDGPFSLKTELIELGRDASGMSGALTPVGAGPVAWRVRVPQKPQAVTVDGKDVKWQMDGDFAMFETSCAAGRRAQWRIAIAAGH